MLARSLMRSALSAPEQSAIASANDAITARRIAATASAAADLAGTLVEPAPDRRMIFAISRFLLERQHGLEDARHPSHRLRFVDHAGTAVFEARIGHLNRRHDVAREDRHGIHDSGEPDELRSGVDADLLFAAHDEIAVGKNFDDRNGDVAGED